MSPVEPEHVPWRASGFLSEREHAVALRGAWGKPTATLDWCEENYVVHLFVAEWYNTLSNLVMIILAIFGIYRTLKQGDTSRVLYSHAALLLVGVGSAAFHGTLLYSAQLLDELPMIWGTSVFVVASSSKYMRTTRFRTLVSGAFLYSFLVTVIYLHNRNPTFHEAAYGVGVVGLVFNFVLRVKEHSNHKSSLLWLLKVGIWSYLTAFLLWNIDNFFCERIRQLREDLGESSAPLLQLHAWWHCGTGFGTYLAIEFVRFVSILEDGAEAKIKFGLGLFPYVSREKAPSKEQ